LLTLPRWRRARADVIAVAGGVLADEQFSSNAPSLTSSRASATMRSTRLAERILPRIEGMVQKAQFWLHPFADAEVRVVARREAERAESSSK
jgi:hypothetical protein